MKVKDLLKNSSHATIVTLTPNNFKSVARLGVIVDVMLLDGKPFCGVHTRERRIQNAYGLNLALFPVRMSDTACHVVSVAIDVLFCMGYLSKVDNGCNNRK